MDTDRAQGSLSLVRAEPTDLQGPPDAPAGMVRLLLALVGIDPPTALAGIDCSVSRSTVYSVLVLSAFAGGAEHGVRPLANEIGMRPSTTLRYLKAWVILGVLEQSHHTRRYRLALRWAEEAQ